LNPQRQPPALFKGQYENASAGYTRVDPVAMASPSSGGVLFADKHLPGWRHEQAGRRAFTSVLIYSLDHLTFNSNHSWIDGPERTATGGCRAVRRIDPGDQQSLSRKHSVRLRPSGLTVGVLNVTTQNISTYCLYAQGTLVRTTDNLAVIMLSNPNACARVAKDGHLMKTNSGKTETTTTGRRRRVPTRAFRSS